MVGREGDFDAILPIDNGWSHLPTTAALMKLPRIFVPGNNGITPLRDKSGCFAIRQTDRLNNKSK